MQLPFGLIAIFISLFLFYYFNKKREIKRDERREESIKYRQALLNTLIKNNSNDKNDLSLSDIIKSIINKNQNLGIEVKKPVTIDEIKDFEKKVGFPLPPDFVDLYSICNGFTCVEDFFILTTLKDIINHLDNYGMNWFYFSEYMVYSDMWGIRLNNAGKYEIFNASYPFITMTSSIKEFLSSFFQGNVFEEGGLYNWLEELKKTE